MQQAVGGDCRTAGGAWGAFEVGKRAAGFGNQQGWGSQIPEGDLRFSADVDCALSDEAVVPEVAVAAQEPGGLG